MTQPTHQMLMAKWCLELRHLHFSLLNSCLQGIAHIFFYKLWFLALVRFQTWQLVKLLPLQILVLWYTLQWNCFHWIQECLCACVLSRVWLFATPWTAAHQAPLSMEFSRQEYWSGLPFLLAGDLPDPGIQPISLALAGRFFTIEPPRKLIGMPKFPYKT